MSTPSVLAPMKPSFYVFVLIVSLGALYDRTY
jgi:hypothetical protein